jgi:DNA-binding MarR family transcriptional regulator
VQGRAPTVAEIARRLRLARQSVQRVADLLAGEGLCSYEDNPRHRRAKLLGLTPKGRKTLARIEDAQRERRMHSASASVRARSAQPASRLHLCWRPLNAESAENVANGVARVD